MFARLAFGILVAVHLSAPASAAEHAGHAAVARRAPELGSAAAFDARGRLWLIGVEDGRVAVRHSADAGGTWSAPVALTDGKEAVSADGENRPKIAFGPKGQLYATWTMPTSPRYTADIRYTRSLDDGATWSAPATVHANRELITHRFDALIVDGAGRIFVAWVDKRDLERHKRDGLDYAGAAIYYAVSDDEGASWRGDFKLAEHSCECCRIALALDADGNAVALWRHVFPGSERDHAMARLDPAGAPAAVERATFDRWNIDACPHHGPALAIDERGVRHAVWFNHAGETPGAFYGRLATEKVEGVLALGSDAEHPDLAVRGKTIRVVWKRFDGERSVIESRRSHDGGVTWTPASLASTRGSADHPRLATRGNDAWLVWRTQKDGVIVRRLQ